MEQKQISSERKLALRPYLAAWAEEHLTPSKTRRGNYICPLCSSSGGGHIKNTFYSCFSCGAGVDLIGLYMAIHSCSFPAAVLALEAWAGTEKANTLHSAQAARQAQEKRRNSYLHITRSYPLSESPAGQAYLKNRGLLHFYAAELGVTAGIDTYGQERLLWPCRHFGTKNQGPQQATYSRAVSPEAKIPRAWIDGGTGLFFAMSDSSAGPVYVCEGQEDALSIYSCGRPAVALGGTSGGPQLLPALDTCPELKDRRFLLMLDNDRPGRRAALCLANELENRGIMWAFIPYCLAPGGEECKDPNELLTAGLLSDLLARF